MKPSNKSYEINEILSCTFKRDCLYFFVSWKGYNESDNTWEPLNNVIDTIEFQKYINDNYSETKFFAQQNILKQEINEDIDKIIVKAKSIILQLIKSFNPHEFKIYQICNLIIPSNEKMYRKLKKLSIENYIYNRERKNQIDLDDYIIKIQKEETRIDVTIENLDDFSVPDNFKYVDQCISSTSLNDLCDNEDLKQDFYSNSHLKLCIFKTPNKGWGLKTEKFIPSNTFLFEYVGELLTKSEADDRSDTTYMFDNVSKDDQVYVIDAKFYGNLSRFLNHSHSANTEVRSVDFLTNLNKLCIFTCRDIKKDLELTFNYNLQTTKKCYCKARNCTGFMD